MAADGPLTESVRRLERALDALDDAIERHFDLERRERDHDEELHKLSADRSRLAAALDTAEARAARLEETNREVSRRLVGAMESIRGVLSGPAGKGDA
ncbi:MAG: DUF4164 domain-containing protein [Bauldia sp.]|nr:DUF4164 domain-containing protein [Bauldia sp.]